MTLRTTMLSFRIGALAAFVSLPACATSPRLAADAAMERPPALKSLKGEPLGVDLRRPGKPTLLVFGANYCASCAAEAPHVKRFAMEHQGRLRVVQVLVDPEQASARAFVRRHQIVVPVAWDPGLRVADHFGVRSTPLLVLLDSDGQVAATATRLDEHLEERVRGFVAFKPAPAAKVDPYIERATTMMGTEVSVLVRAAPKDHTAAVGAIEDAFAEMRRVEALMSSWTTTSQISAINRRAGLGPVKVDLELFDLLMRSRSLAAETRGAFDVTWKGAGELWDFKAADPAVPTPSAIRTAMKRVGIDRLVLDRSNQTAFLRDRGMALGLGGVAKGHAVDQAVKLLEERGYKHFVINAGGDMYVRGRKAPNQLWWVALRHPRLAKTSLAVLPVANRAVVTSGDYERFFMKDGQRYSHILDPRTGYPAKACQSVTVVAPSTARADALATGVFVLGPEQGMALVEQLEDAEAVIVDAAGQLHVSTGLRKRAGGATRR